VISAKHHIQPRGYELLGVSLSLLVLCAAVRLFCELG